MQNLIIGSHVSFNKNEQLLGSTIEAVSYKANTFMFYTGAPQNTNRYPIDFELVNMAKKLMKEQNIDINNVIVHAPYIINLANTNNFDFNVKFLKEELKRKELEDEKEEKKVQEVLLNIKSRFGKNAILKGMNLEEGGTTIERNGQVGGHKG